MYKGNEYPGVASLASKHCISRGSLFVRKHRRMGLSTAVLSALPLLQALPLLHALPLLQEPPLESLHGLLAASSDNAQTSFCNSSRDLLLVHSLSIRCTGCLLITFEVRMMFDLGYRSGALPKHRDSTRVLCRPVGANITLLIDADLSRPITNGSSVQTSVKVLLPLPQSLWLSSANPM